MDLRELSSTYNAALGQLENIGRQLSEDGFVHLVDPNGEFPESKYAYDSPEWTEARKRYRERTPPIGNTFVRKIAKKTASELGRPVVVAETDFWDEERKGRTKVTIRRARARGVLVAEFILLDLRNTSKPVSFWQDGTNWYVQFAGEKGQRAFRRWCEFIRTDPACRKALKLDA